MKYSYFVSDIHLGFGSRESDIKRENLFIKFLDDIKGRAGSLYILGDLFDFWFEYRRVVPKGYFRTLAKLYELKKGGVEIFFLIGNHDCLIRDYFEKEVGMKVIRDELVVEIEGKKFFLHHGDGLLKKDLGYKILKRILRNKFNQWLFSLCHPDFGMWLGSISSQKSRRYTSKKDYGMVDGALEFAKLKINSGYDYVLMGHVHKSVCIKIDNGLYINLGDWIENYSYAVFDGNELKLEKIQVIN